MAGVVKKPEFDLDQILNEFGNLGRFHLVNFFLLSIVIVLSALFSVAFVFTAGDLTYRCFVPGCDYGNASYDEPWLPFTIPVTSKSGYENCKMFKAISNESCSMEDFSTEIEDCQQWIYDSDEYTILREDDWGLHCPENLWKLGFVGSINNFGQLLGLPLSGFISDKYGRKLMLIISSVTVAVIGIVKAFSISYEMFLTFEFIDPVVSAGLYNMAFVLALELVKPSHRVLAGTVLACAWTVGEVIIAIIAYLVPYWKYILLICYVPSFLIIFYYWLVPESVRWLLAKGRTEEAAAVLKKMERANRISFPDSTWTNIEEPNQTKNIGIRKMLYSIISSKTMVLRFLNCSFCWMANNFVYFGLSLNAVVIHGDKYLNFIASSLVEIPACLLVYFTLDRFGRRPSQCWTLALSALGCMSFAAIPSDLSYDWARLTAFLIGKFAITASFGVLYIYTTEMFPTSIRLSVLSLCSTIAKLGSVVAPFTPLLAVYWESMPLIIFGGLSLIAAISSIAFPETVNTYLPETLEECEEQSQGGK